MAAYDDHAGVTAASTSTALRVMNSELDADFDPTASSTEAHGTTRTAGSRCTSSPPTTRPSCLRGLEDLEVTFAAGEQLRTEISTKFTPDQVVDELWEAGLVVDEQWLDPDGDFALTLAHPYC